MFYSIYTYVVSFEVIGVVFEVVLVIVVILLFFWLMTIAILPLRAVPALLPFLSVTAFAIGVVTSAALAVQLFLVVPVPSLLAGALALPVLVPIPIPVLIPIGMLAAVPIVGSAIAFLAAITIAVFAVSVTIAILLPFTIVPFTLLVAIISVSLALAFWFPILVPISFTILFR